MLRNVKLPKAKKPVMVMLHGSGSSRDIFSVQTYALAKELAKDYDLVFLDAPVPSTPGPGVLPLFADMPNYHRWLTPANAAISQLQRLAEIAQVATHIQEQLEAQNVASEQVVAMLGFSQGALVAMAMLGLRLICKTQWSNLRFCVAIGAGTTGNTAQMDSIQDIIASLAGALGCQEPGFPGYSVQASGLTDAWYKDGKRLASMCANERTRVLVYRDGHVVPRKRPDVLKLVQAIQEISEISARHFDPVSAADSFALEDIHKYIAAQTNVST